MNDSAELSTEEPLGGTILLLVPSSEIAQVLGEALGHRQSFESSAIEIRGEPVVESVRNARRRGEIPIAFVALDEVDALDAISEGADEVLVWPPRDALAIQGFFDRTLLRACQRKRHARSGAAAAHLERLATLGTLVAGVAHEINNPLTALQLGVESCVSLLNPLTKVVSELAVWTSRGWSATPEQIAALYAMARSGAPNVDDKLLLDEMLSAATAMATIVRDLRVFARSDAGTETPETLDVHELIERALRLVGRELTASAQLERDFSPALSPIVAPPGRLTQVLVNVLVNAVHAIRDFERPAHRIRISTRSDTEILAIAISDTGPGIPPEFLARIFDPFFTTKRSGAGTGLGLSISRSIMQEMGGDLIVESVHGEGATFIALLPLPRQLAAHPSHPSPRSLVPPRQTVLLVDDDPRVLKAYTRLLASGCDVLTARDGQEAIELLSSGSRADAVVTELSLPELDGQALFNWIRQQMPTLAFRTVFVSCDVTRERYQEFLSKLPNSVLTKPVSADALWGALSALSRTPEPSSEALPPREKPAS